MDHRLQELRGTAYVAEMKRILAEEGPRITKRFNELREYGGFTPRGLGTLAFEFQLPLTVLDDYLPDLTGGAYKTGTWERLKDRGCKARDIMPQNSTGDTTANSDPLTK
jgi:hypothetical protein